MRLSCRGRYATRALIELALHHGKKPLSLKIIEENQGISKKYLTQLMGGLKVAGLVIVFRGKQGGFMLSRHPSEITLDDILSAVEGNMSIVDCVATPHLCERSNECMLLSTWTELSHVIKDYLKSVTLADIVKKKIISQISEAQD